MTDAFFIGWSKTRPSPLASVLALGIVVALAGMALALGSAVDDPGDGHFDWDLGEQTRTGTVAALPYPLLRLPPDADHPLGHALMLAGEGKTGVQALAAGLDGHGAVARGIVIKRGSLDMLQVGGDGGLSGAAAPVPSVPAPVALGRWRLTGEICDGKCDTGAMRPGSGLAHKACANLCLLGGVPPVFVSTAPVAGSEFLLLADPQGRPLPDSFRDLVALRIQLDGAVERIDDLLMFKVDLAKAVRP